MADTMNLQVLMAVYPDTEGAAKALKTIKELQSDDVLTLVDAATLVKGSDGKVKVDEVRLPHAKSGGVKGAVLGGVVGLIFPPSILAGAIVGGGLGAGVGAIRHKTKLPEDLTRAAEELEPNTSAILAIMQDRVVDAFIKGVQGYERLAQTTLDADTVAAINEELESSSN